MPDTDKVEMEYSKLEGKGWLYKNENKTSENHPDFKGKLAGIEISKLAEFANAEGRVDILLSGWSEEDKNGAARLGMKPSLSRPKQSVAATLPADVSDPFSA
tara:strand:- start:679 stop:984 length:306 start_codon:yes stop_codon:yes gene_type:complete